MPATAISDVCPPGAAALGVAGLGSLCGAAGGAVGSAASSVAGAGVDGVLGALGSWVSQGAVWLLDQVGAVLTATTSIDLGASWFTQHYQTMAALCGVVILPMLLLGIVQALYRQDLTLLLRSVLVNVPLALLLTAVAVKLVQLGLSVTDELSAAVSQGAGLDATHFMTSVTDALGGSSGQPAVPAFVVFLGGIAVVVGAFLVWIELLIRAAAVYVAVLFLPLGLASLAWPAVAHWCRRLVDTLVALVLGKFVVVAVLSLASGALSAGASGQSGGGGFSSVLGGAALLLLAALAPWALFRLLPFLEAGAVAHLEGLSQRARQTARVPTRGMAQTALRLATASAAGGAAGALLGGSGVGGSTEMPGRGTNGAGPTSGAGGPGLAGLLGRRRGGERPRGEESSDGFEPPWTGGDTGEAAHIPRWPSDPEVSALAREWGLDEQTLPSSQSPSSLQSGSRDAMEGSRDAVEGHPAASFATGGGSSGAVAAAGTGTVIGNGDGGRTVALPRQTGAALVDRLERDELGARLVSRPPAALPPASYPLDGPVVDADDTVAFDD